MNISYFIVSFFISTNIPIGQLDSNSSIDPVFCLHSQQIELNLFL